jgi:hypothetical protein
MNKGNKRKELDIISKIARNHNIPKYITANFKIRIELNKTPQKHN